MADAPTISAIVPVHNGAAYITDALRSIRAQLHPVSELIVVDDGSTDASADLVARFDSRAILIKQSQSGPGPARNTGAQNASGEWLAFLDHDDIWPPDRTGALLQGIAASPSAGFVCGRVLIEEISETTLDPRMRAASGSHLPILINSALIRRNVWLAIGGMDRAVERAEDVEFYLRLVDAGVPVAKIEATTLIWRQHGDNRSRVAKLDNAAMLSGMRAAIARRRKMTL
jgi:glycosyltransferase involved in cell wall biosynthesis